MPVLLGLAVLIALASGTLIWLAREQQQQRGPYCRRRQRGDASAPTVVLSSEPGMSPSNSIDEPIAIR
ncbi:MAG: hypothetical protein WKF84_00515 [Pyrinomonadaceae bacterium]